MSQVLKLSRFRPGGMPVLLVGGLPLSGKTTFIRRLIECNPQLTVHWMEGDRCDEPSFSDWFSKQMQELVGRREADYVILELPHSEEVRGVIEAFGSESSLGDQAWVDAVVTVLDGGGLVDCLSRWKRGLELGAPEPETEAYEQAGFLVDQIEYADLLYVSRGEELTPAGVASVTESLRLLQPRARLVFSPLGADSAEGIVMARWFDERATSQGSTRVQALLECTDEFSPGLERFEGKPYLVYRRRRPFHPERLWEFLHHFPAGVLRTYGAVWLAAPEDMAFGLEQFGMEFLDLAPDGAWIDSMDSDSKEWFWNNHGEMVHFWDESNGDRYTELVFIGRNFLRSELVTALDACLVTEEEFRSDWGRLTNPIPGLAPQAPRPLKLVHSRPPPR